MSTKALSQMIIYSVCLLLLSACTLKGLKSQISLFFIEQEIAVLNSETDLSKIKVALQKNISQLELMLESDTDNEDLHIYAAQAYYSYAFSFIEDVDKKRATKFYDKAFHHASTALKQQGISSNVLQGKLIELNKKISTLDGDAVAALYWTAVSWAKLIEMQQPNLLLLFDLRKTKILMEQVERLHSTYHNAGPDLFFAVYYASLPQYFGGNHSLARKHFSNARKFNKNRLLIVDFLQAKYLNDIKSYNQRLNEIINASDNLYPEQALINSVAKQKAKFLLDNPTAWRLSLQLYAEFISWIYSVENYINDLLKI